MPIPQVTPSANARIDTLVLLVIRVAENRLFDVAQRRVRFTFLFLHPFSGILQQMRKWCDGCFGVRIEGDRGAAE